MSPKAASGAYWDALDGLRLIAFFLVAFHHTAGLTSLYRLDLGQFGNHLKACLAVNGWCGVDLFFVISGYLITSNLLRERTQTGDVSLRNFYARRALRIFPVFYLFLLIDTALAFTLPLEQLYNIPACLLAFTLFVGNFMVAAAPLSVLPSFGPLWSLCIEEQFYLGWGWILKRVNCLDTLPKLLFGAYAFNVILRMILDYATYPQHHVYYMNTFSHLDGLIGGCLAAYYYKAWMPWLSQRAKLSAVLQACAVMSIALVVCTVRDINLIITLTCPLWTILVCCCVATGNRVLANPVITYFGRRTYAAYVFQVGIGIYLNYFIALKFPQLLSDLGWLIIALDLLVAEGIWWLVEKPVKKLKARFGSAW